MKKVKQIFMLGVALMTAFFSFVGQVSAASSDHAKTTQVKTELGTQYHGEGKVIQVLPDGKVQIVTHSSSKQQISKIPTNSNGTISFVVDGINADDSNVLISHRNYYAKNQYYYLIDYVQPNTSHDSKGRTVLTIPAPDFSKADKYYIEVSDQSFASNVLPVTSSNVGQTLTIDLTNTAPVSVSLPANGDLHQTELMPQFSDENGQVIVAPIIDFGAVIPFGKYNFWVTAEDQKNYFDLVKENVEVSNTNHVVSFAKNELEEIGYSINDSQNRLSAAYVCPNVEGINWTLCSNTNDGLPVYVNRTAKQMQFTFDSNDQWSYSYEFDNHDMTGTTSVKFDTNIIASFRSQSNDSYLPGSKLGILYRNVVLTDSENHVLQSINTPWGTPDAVVSHVALKNMNSYNQMFSLKYWYDSIDLPSQLGNYSVKIDFMGPVSIPSVTGTITVGNGSGTHNPPKAPSVDPVKDIDTKVTGTSAAGATITVNVGNHSIGIGTVGTDGKFAVPIPPQAGGTVLLISATDKNGSVSAGTLVTVLDTTSPKVPIVNPVGDSDKTITGTAEANSTVTVNIGNKVLGTSQATKNGSFSVSIKPQVAGSILSITAMDASKNVSQAVKVTVADHTPPSSPKVNTVKDTDTMVVGTAEAKSTITVKNGNVILGTAKASATGNFSLKIKSQIGGSVLSITATDASGNMSKAVTVIVKDTTSPLPPKVNPVKNTDTKVTGTAEPGSTITIKVGTKVIGTGTVGKDGKFSITINPLATGTVLRISATDESGNVSAETDVTVKKS